MSRLLRLGSSNEGSNESKGTSNTIGGDGLQSPIVSILSRTDCTSGTCYITKSVDHFLVSQNAETIVDI